MSHRNADNFFAIIPDWVLYAEISPQAVRLYCILQTYADRTTGECFPNKKTLAVDLKVNSTRTVDAALNELKDIGAVKVTNRFNGQEYTSNLYTVVTQNVAGYSREVHKVTQSDALGHAVDCPQTITIKQQPSNEKRYTPEFEKFWEAYPLKAGKQAAFKAFTKALKVASLEEIIEGAVRYANSPAREPQFTKYPQGWLNDGRWADEQQQAPLSKIQTKANRALAFAAQLEKEGQRAISGDF